MANTVNLLNYANTFGDWVVTTNALTKENNDLAINNYHKNSGTLYLDTSSLALQSNGNAIFAQQLAVQGIGSYLTVQNNATVGATLNLSNTGMALISSGQANISGPIMALGSGTGLTVANNANILKQLTVNGETELNNSLAVSGTINVSNNVMANSVTANSNITAPVYYVTSKLDANSAVSAYLPNTVIAGSLQISGNFVLAGNTTYTTPYLTLAQGGAVNQNGYLNIYRPTGANASLRWYEPGKYWDILDVNTGGTYSKLLTANLISDSLTSTSSSTIASSNAIYSLNNSIVSTITPAITSVYARANSSINQITGSTGTAAPTDGNLNLTSSNGITVTGSGNTVSINTSQDLRNTASPTFNSLTLTAPLGLAHGGTGATSSAAALTALLPTGTSAGYVLTTGGPGNFYWSASSGGGSGATPGTAINSTRLSYTATTNGQQIFTTPTFTSSTQVRAYINGVRQFESEYTLNQSANTISFSTAPSNGDGILIEVDGYYINPYYANNIVFTAPQGSIPSSANTIQLAINDLESRKATLASPSFTGTPLSSTAELGTSNTMIATTAFVNNTANSGATFTHNITGNAGTVTNGVYTNGTYNNPSWITGIANTKITGTITSSQIAGITSSHVTTALGYTPYNATNPSGYITSSGTATAFSSTTQNSQFNSVGVGTAGSGTAGEIRATNNITAYYSSDKKFKENITDIDNAVEIVSHIGGKLFDWTDEYINTHGGEDGYFIRKSDFGVIAQDVQAVFPRAVRVKSDESLAVDYEKLCALAFAAIRELKAEIDTLKGI
jgi:hypothetical protein